MPSNHLILHYPLFLLPSIFPIIRVVSNESVFCIRWPNCWCFNFSISSSNEYSGLTSFQIDCFDLLAVQGTLKSLLQYHSSKASILQHSAFFIVQLSHPYMTTGKTITLTTGNNIALTSISASICVHSLWFKMFCSPGTFENKYEPQLYLYSILRLTG